MAGGVAKEYARTWVYNPGGDRFEDRVGCILSRGHNLKETFQKQSLEVAKKTIAFENEQRKNGTYNPTGAASDFYKQTEGSSRRQEVDKRGMVWVTPEGQTLGPASNQTFSELPPPPTPKQGLATESQRHMANLSPQRRSMHMWRRVNPGCVESTTQMPNSTYKDHFVHQPDMSEPLNKERYRTKSDFTAYADQKIKYGTSAGR